MGLSHQTKVINLFAGPGAGKSTAATGVFSLLKMHDVNCEYVSEVAKDLAWEGRLKDATYFQIVGRQIERMERLRGKVDYIISDSPLLLQGAYTNDETEKKVALEQFEKWDNINYFVHRTKKFNPKGRGHNEEESKQLDFKIQSMLKQYDYGFYNIRGDYHGINHIAWNALDLLGKPILINLEGKLN